MISTRKELIEKLAELEHEQGSKYEPLWVPYKELSEEMKEKNRAWAVKFLELVEDSYLAVG